MSNDQETDAETTRHRALLKIEDDEYDLRKDGMARLDENFTGRK